MSQALAIAKYELLNYRRSRRFLLLLVLVVGGSVAASGAVGYFRPAAMLSGPTPFLTYWIGYTIAFVVAMPASFLGGDAISNEFQSRTGYSMVGNPIKRTSIFIGKAAAAFAACMALLSIYEAVTLANAGYYFGLGIPVQFWESFAFAAVAVGGALGLAFLFSSLIKNGAFAVLLSVVLLVYGFNVIENVLDRLTSFEPWFFFSYGAQIVSAAFAVPFPDHIAVHGTLTTYFPTIAEGLAILGGYCVLGMLASVVVFGRREFA
jgi:ABC-2 type transport system permease protein